MTVIINTLSVIACLIAGVLITALFIRKGYNIQREIIINSPQHRVFGYLRFLKNWDNFNERAVADPNREVEFRGTDGAAGFIYAWKGNSKVGEGEKEIMSVSEGKKIDTEIRFIKPFAVVGHSNMVTEPMPNDHTKVIFSNASTLKYPLNFLLLFVEKGIAKDMEISLSTLKNILEK
jgi:hypothetical protein